MKSREFWAVGGARAGGAPLKFGTDSISKTHASLLIPYPEFTEFALHLGKTQMKS